MLSAIEVGEAVIQGTITVVGVTLGVGLTEFAVRARERRRSIQRITIRFTVVLPHYLSVISESWDENLHPRPDTGLGSEWWTVHDEIFGMISSARTDARWIGNAKVIREELDDLSARNATAEFNWMQRRQLVPQGSLPDVLSADLTGAVFGPTETIDDALDFYIAHGFGNRYEKSLQKAWWRRVLKRGRSDA